MIKNLHSRKDKLIIEKRHDVYQTRNKWSEFTRCMDCGALYVNGRWTWQAAPAKSHETICPACRRIIDRFPAGFLEIKGPFFAEHRDEILNLIHNVEIQEKSEHPLERIMALTPKNGCLVITTTGLHLARRIGEALAHAYKGELSIQYAEAGDIVRVQWQR
jgi:hypothetical protein